MDLRDASKESPKGLHWIAIAGSCPTRKLREVDAAVAGLAVVNPRLRFLQSFSEIALREVCRFAQLQEQETNGQIVLSMLSFNAHLTHFECQEA